MGIRLSEYNTEKFRGLRADFRESRLQRVRDLILREPRGALLDVGCGSGDFSCQFLSQGFTVYGLDLTVEQVEIARSKGVSAQQHDISSGRLPYEDAAFSVVFAGEVIEHLVDTTAFLREVHRVLKPQGSFVLTTPNLASFENRVRLLFGFYPKWLEYKLEGGQGHVRGYTPRALKEHLADIGFTVERVRGNWVPFLPQRYADDLRMPWLSFTGRLFPSLSMDLIVQSRA